MPAGEVFASVDKLWEDTWIHHAKDNHNTFRLEVLRRFRAREGERLSSQAYCRLSVRGFIVLLLNHAVLATSVGHQLPRTERLPASLDHVSVAFFQLSHLLNGSSSPFP